MQLLDIYESVYYSAHFLQPNELQLRQLLILPTRELMQRAWQRVTDHGEPVTAAAVRNIARAVWAEEQQAPLSALLQPDRTFPGIPFRWGIPSTTRYSTNNQHGRSPQPKF